MFKITNILFKKNNNFNKSSHYRWNNNTLNFELINSNNFDMTVSLIKEIDPTLVIEDQQN